MADPTLETSLNQPPEERQAHRPHPAIAAAIRARCPQILDEWRGRTLFSMPELSELTIKEFHNHITLILSAMADALESNEAPDLRKLVETAPEHGFQRFMLDYDLVELFSEERILRRAIVRQVEEELRRQCTPEEAATLHSLIDVMLQQGVLAFVQQQSKNLRKGAEAELKYLSFLSHDLGNNLFVISSSLHFIEKQIAGQSELLESAEVLRAASETIQHTRDGMRRLLQHERLRRAGQKASSSPQKLLESVERTVRLATNGGRTASPRIEVKVDPAIVVLTDADLLTILLQNLLGNAVKHAAAVVRVDCERTESTGKARAKLIVADDGGGIPADQMHKLFHAFEQIPQMAPMNTEGSGFGLGLAIAAQAAELIGTKIEVESTNGQGSKFSFSVPIAE